MTPGQVLAARYELRKAIGRGGMGEVWVGYDRVLIREVALKLLDVRAAGDDRAAERFHREATAAAALSHPHVVAIYDAGVEDGLAFLVMELLSGPTVADLVQERGPLPVDLALDLARQAAAGLGAVHRVGVVHRDVKPSNLMLDEHGRMKVVDFGIARLAEATTPQVTTTGSVVGSAAFLSPEQARGEPATAASDHYALGCTLMAMLTGQPPFSAEHPVALLRSHLDDPPPRARDRRPDVPPGVDELVDNLLAKDPRRRASGVAELLDNHPSAPEPTRPEAPTAVLPATSDSPPPPGTGRRLPPRGLLALAGAVLIAVFAVAALVGLPAGDDTAPRSQTPAESATDSGPVESAPTPPDSTAPPGDGTATLTAAVDGLDDAVQQSLNEGGLDEKAADDLEQQIEDLRKRIEEGKLDDFDKKLDDLVKKIDKLESKGELDAAGATRIREAIDDIRTEA